MIKYNFTVYLSDFRQFLPLWLAMEVTTVAVVTTTVVDTTTVEDTTTEEDITTVEDTTTEDTTTEDTMTEDTHLNHGLKNPRSCRPKWRLKRQLNRPHFPPFQSTSAWNLAWEWKLRRESATVCWVTPSPDATRACPCLKTKRRVTTQTV